MPAKKIAAKKSVRVMSPLRVGQGVFIRTVTMHYVGRVVALEGDAVILTDASWVADSGRFSVALLSGVLNEVERTPGPVLIGRGAIVDVFEWNHSLPVETK